MRLHDILLPAFFALYVNASWRAALVKRGCALGKRNAARLSQRRARRTRRTPLANGATWTEIFTDELTPQIFQSEFKLLPVFTDDVPIHDRSPVQPCN